MPFDPKVKSRMFTRCARICCLCRKQCGVNIEAAHIIAESEGGRNDEENCIPVCFDCHQEIGGYNVKHPKGNKFRPDELRERRDAIYEMVASGKIYGTAVSGAGGKGGNAKVGGNGIAIGGPGGGGGAPGAASGGDGGDAEVTGDGFAHGGEGGEAGQGDRGGRGGRSPIELLGVRNYQLPDGRWLWDFGRGGNGGAPVQPDETPSSTTNPKESN